MSHTITQIVSVEPPCADFQAPLEYRGLQVNSLYPETFRTCTRSIANIGHARGHPSGAFKTTHIEIEPRRQKRTNRADRVGRRDRIHKYFPKGKSYNEKKDRPGMEMFLRWLQVALVRRASVAGDSGLFTGECFFIDCSLNCLLITGIALLIRMFQRLHTYVLMCRLCFFLTGGWFQNSVRYVCPALMVSSHI